MVYVRFLLIILLISVFLAGCGSTATTKRGKVSDVMAKASNDHKGRRHVETQEPMRLEEEEETMVSEPEPATVVDSEPDNDVPFTGGFAGLGYERGHGFFSSKKYSAHDSYYGSLAFKGSEKWRSAFLIGYESVEINPSSSLYQSVSKDLSVLSIGGKAQRMFGDVKQKVRPYLEWGAGVSYLLWRYNNPVTTSSGSTVYSDSVSGITLFLGSGISIEPVKFIRISAEVVPKLHLWGDTTRLDFDNDVFEAIGLIDTNVSLHFLF